MFKRIRFVCLAAMIGAFLLMPLEGLASTYSDISGHWAATTIVKGQEMGAVSGYEDNTYRPD